MSQHHDCDPFAVIEDLVHVDVSESTADFIRTMVDDLYATILRHEHRHAQLESREPAPCAGAIDHYAELHGLLHQLEHFSLEAHLTELRDPAPGWVGRDLPPTQPQARGGDLPPMPPLPAHSAGDHPPTPPFSAYGGDHPPTQLQLDVAHATSAEPDSLDIKA
ncbi:hypothetical protein EIP86_000821 [Pleurotus ostreatoroseus]|nr:hypothetical protein EIP86_000821 [Pleurotus ostreatoroseus]